VRRAGDAVVHGWRSPALQSLLRVAAAAAAAAVDEAARTSSTAV